ncbi:MAG: hypothetical protein ABIQ60_01805 [Burkholderiaceae bacterium]
MQTQAIPTPIRPLLCKDEAAAALLQISVRALRKDRAGEQRIPFVRLGKSIRYSIAALEKFANGGAR